MRCKTPILNKYPTPSLPLQASSARALPKQPFQTKHQQKNKFSRQLCTETGCKGTK